MKPSDLCFTPDQKAVWETLRAKYVQQGRWEVMRQVSDLIVQASVGGWTDAEFERRFRAQFELEAEKWRRLLRQ